MAALSILVGSFAGLRQTNIKRLIAYSSVGHVGFILLGLAAGTALGMHMALLYIMIYVVMSAGTFAVILNLHHNGAWHEDINALSGLAKTKPVLAASFADDLCSRWQGIPPFAGFFAKLYVLQAAMQANLIALSVIAVVASVVAAYYYLRLIKIMYFDEPSHASRRGFFETLYVHRRGLRHHPDRIDIHATGFVCAGQQCGDHIIVIASPG